MRINEVILLLEILHYQEVLLSLWAGGKTAMFICSMSVSLSQPAHNHNHLQEHKIYKIATLEETLEETSLVNSQR